MRLGLGLGLARLRGSSIDPAAAAYFAATGLTGATEKAAVNTLVRSLKSAGLWSKMKAVYPFVTDNRNLLSYTEDFGNGYWDKSNSLVTTNTTTAPNGTTTADTLNEGTTTAWHRIWNFSSGSNVITGSTYTYSIYLKAGTETVVQLNTYNIYASNSFNYANFDLQNGVLGTYANCTPNIESVGNGWYRCSITQTSVVTSTSFVYATFANGNASAGERPSYTGTNDTFYLWGAQLELGSSATTYQPIATTQQSYISNQFKYNLVNPVDSDAAFRGVFNGGWTFSNNGAKGNAVNNYINTNFKNSDFADYNSTSIFYYGNVGTNTSSWDIGNIDSMPNSRITIPPAQSSIYYQFNSANLLSVTYNTKNGFFGMNRISSTQVSVYANNSKLTTVNEVAVANLNTNTFAIGNQWSTQTGNNSDRLFKFVSFGGGLTDTEATALYNAVNQFQVSLSRNV